jgi:hypothetical protein
MVFSQTKRAGMVWVLSGLFLLAYGGLGLFAFTIPGLQELVVFIQDLSGMHLYTAAFLSILFEGLYIIGNFIPGSTLVLLLAILSQTGGITSFLFTIVSIFCGWCLAGYINIFVTAKVINRSTVPPLSELVVQDRLLTTWYPAFRANYEVAQVVSGIPARTVLWSSIRVKFYASMGAALYALILPYFIDINSLNNAEGFAIVSLIGIICIAVGGWQWKR